MDISNKALAMFLLAAIVVSLGGTMVSLNKLDSTTTTGFATNTSSGTASLTVDSALSITADDAAIAFGTCTPVQGQHIVIDSKATLPGTGNCSGFSADYIAIRNDGNVDANVTVNASDWGEAHGGSFLPAASSAASALAYTITNDGDGSNSGGCQSYPSGYTNFTSGAEYRACDNLTPAAIGGANSFLLDVQVVLPYDAITGPRSVTFGFTARNA